MSVPENTKGARHVAGAAVGVVGADRSDRAASREPGGNSSPAEIAALRDDDKMAEAL